MRFVDLHCHLIPGIDDGATSLVEALDMLRYAHDHGTRAMVASPHTFHSSFGNEHPLPVHDAYSRFVQRLRLLSDNQDSGFLREMAVYLGAENFVSAEFFEALGRREVLTLNGSRYLLVEFPPFLAFDAVDSAVEKILESGLIPVLAHVERYGFFDRNLERLAVLRKRGCVAQINAESVVDLKRRGIARAIRPILDAGLVDVVASDCHDVHFRPPDLAEASRVLLESFPKDAVAAWFWDNPARVLRDERILREPGAR